MTRDALLQAIIASGLPLPNRVKQINRIPIVALSATMFFCAARESRAQMSMAPSPLGISMDRMGSGTSWIPDAVSLPSKHWMSGNWDYMLHGFAYGQYVSELGPRGASQIGSLNWAMLMASHELAGGRFQARAMLSLDAAGIADGGYPLLLQSGETYRGRALKDRQHPHDFFMELGVVYERQLSRSLGVSFYAAPSGEPALGPVAFMHRPSAMDNPEAGIGHHWQDVTHTSFGVLTAGVFTRTLKLEASMFNGQEPHENRWNLDFHPMASYSARATFNPNAAWSFTGGFAFIKEPETTDIGHSMHRTAVSAQYGQAIGGGQWATSLIWSANTHADESRSSNSYLAETEAVLDVHNTVFARAEHVQKSAEDLSLDKGPGAFDAERTFAVSRVSLGYIREVASWRGATIGIGAMGNVAFVPTALEQAYGSATPRGFTLFVRLRAMRPASHDMSHMSQMSHMTPPSSTGLTR